MQENLNETEHLKKERESFYQHLIELGYSKATVQNYERVILHFEQFMSTNNLSEYSENAKETYLSTISNQYSKSSLINKSRMLRQFNSFINGEDFILRPKLVSRECPEQFDNTLTNYLEHLRSRGLKEVTIESYQYNILRVLRIFDKASINSIEDIKPKDIYGAFEKCSDKASFSVRMYGFFRYLYENKVLKNDYSTLVPSVRKSHPNPSVYTKSETERLLSNIDLTTDYGNRNYAVILLALRLGMRSCDIANLKIADIDFNHKEISFYQVKTQVFQRLELLPEIEDALLSYMSRSRPDSNIPNIFLSVKPPIKAITSHAILASTRYHLKNSGIEIGERKSGAHSLRMTLASELTAEKVPYDVIRKILGHTDPTSIKHYVKFDMESLRSCALEVPPITGKLALYMTARLGGQAQ